MSFNWSSCRAALMTHYLPYFKTSLPSGYVYLLFWQNNTKLSIKLVKSNVSKLSSVTRPNELREPPRIKLRAWRCQRQPRGRELCSPFSHEYANVQYLIQNVVPVGLALQSTLNVAHLWKRVNFHTTNAQVLRR